MSILTDYSSYTLAELEYLAENELIEIIPRLRVDEPLQLLSGTFGPFVTGVPIQVPLWLAMRIKDDNLCFVQPPPWMQLDALEAALDADKRNDESFSVVPFHYQQIATVLLTGSAAEDIPDRERIAELLDDLDRVRSGKLARNIRKALESAATQSVATQYTLNNASALEVNMLRVGFFKAVDHIVEMSEEQASRDKAVADVAAAGAAGGGKRVLLRTRLRKRGGADGAAPAGGAGGDDG